jgi:hypothetical protein
MNKRSNIRKAPVGTRVEHDKQQKARKEMVEKALRENEQLLREIGDRYRIFQRENNK